MGGRGARFGIYYRRAKDGTEIIKIYGEEYTSLLEVDNIKFIKSNANNVTSPLETMTKGRIYVTLDKNNKPKYITFYDKDNKRNKLIEINGRPHLIDGVKTSQHTHYGYEHNEYGNPTDVTNKDKEMIAKVIKLWDNHNK